MIQTPLVFKLSKIICEEETLSDVIEALLQTIFFHRTLGPIEIDQKRCLKLKRISYMRSGDQSVGKSVQDIIDEIKVDHNINHSQAEFQIQALFMEEENQKLFGWFKQKKLRVFEKWIIPIQLKFPINTDGDSQRMETEDNLVEQILKVSEIANSNCDHFDLEFEPNKPLKYQYQLSYTVGKILE